MEGFHRTLNREIVSSYLDENKESFNPSRLLSPTEASFLLGVSVGTLSVWRSNGRYALTYIKCGRLVKYRVSDVLQFLESRRVELKLGARNEI